MAKLSCLTSITNATTATKSASVAGIAALTLPKPASLASSATAEPTAGGVAAGVAKAGHTEKTEETTKSAGAKKSANAKKTDEPDFDPDADEELFCEAASCPPEKKARCPYYNASAVAEKSKPQTLRANYIRLLKAGDVPGDASDRNYESYLTDKWIADRYDEGADLEFVWDDEGEPPSADVQQALTDERIERALDHMALHWWTYAAHHLISTNQIFATLPRLVKLANAYKEPVAGEDPATCERFDINGGWNCIMLPSVHGWDEDDDDEAEKAQLTKDEQDAAKKARHNAGAFDVMSLIGQQWHVGPHGRVLTADEEAQARRQMGFLEHRPRALKSYAASVVAELQKLEKTMLDERNKTCRNTVEQKQMFLRWMKALARKLKCHLSAFQDNPKKGSYPFYVSIEAYRFAFSIPITTKVAVLQKADAQTMICQTFRAEHRGKTASDVELHFKETGDALRLAWPLDDDGKRRLIERLENIQYFIVTDGLTPDAFPFLCVDSIDAGHFCTIRDKEPDETAQDVLENRTNTIAIWLRDERMTEGPYVSKMRMVRKRLEKVERM